MSSSASTPARMPPPKKEAATQRRTNSAPVVEWNPTSARIQGRPRPNRNGESAAPSPLPAQHREEYGHTHPDCLGVHSTLNCPRPGFSTRSPRWPTASNASALRCRRCSPLAPVRPLLPRPAETVLRFSVFSPTTHPKGRERAARQPARRPGKVDRRPTASRTVRPAWPFLGPPGGGGYPVHDPPSRHRT